MRLGWMGRLLTAVLILFGAFCVINMAADYQRGSYPAMLPGFLTVIAWPFLPFLNGHLAVRRWEGRNPAGQRTLTVRIDENRFASRSYAGAVELRWDAATHVVETSEFLLVYVAYGAGYFLPLRMMSAEERAQVRGLLRSTLDPKRLHLRAA